MSKGEQHVYFKLCALQPGSTTPQQAFAWKVLCSLRGSASRKLGEVDDVVVDCEEGRQVAVEPADDLSVWDRGG